MYVFVSSGVCEGVDPSSRQTSPRALISKFLGGSGRTPLCQRFVYKISAIHALHRTQTGELLATDHVAHFYPVAIEQDPRKNVAVIGFEYIHRRCETELVSPTLERYIKGARGKIAVALKDNAIDKGNVDVLSFAGAIAMT